MDEKAKDVGMLKIMFAVAVLAGSMVLFTGCGGYGDKSGASPTKAPGSSIPVENQARNPEPRPDEVPQALLKGQFDKVHERFEASFQASVSVAQLKEAYAGVAGGVTEWKPYSKMQLAGVTHRVWTDPDGRVGLLGVFGDGNVILGLRLQPLESFPMTDNTPTKLAYGLPVEGEWLVLWGGRNVFANYHYEHETQRYAYDFIQTEDGSSHRGDPSKNESYYAYGQPILAPQDGTVVQVVNDIKDNDPVGTMNKEHPAGNVVVIDHGNGEFSILAHLQEGSAKVKPGDTVKKGDHVGLCGNSGNSSEPHLHYQVSDRSDLFSGKSVRVHWDGELDPIQGMVIGGK